MNLDGAIVYDIETYPNVFTMAFEGFFTEDRAVWEISQYRDDRHSLLEFLHHLSRTQTFGIGFNNLHFDYPILHFIMNNPDCTVQQIYEKSQQIINSKDNFGHTIWANKRLFPQIDLYKIYHFDNMAKSTSLKYLQINMRSDTVVDLPVKHGTMLSQEITDMVLVPYNFHDVAKTKRFAQIAEDAINFRLSLVDEHGIDVLNWNDTKIGEMTMVKKIGNDMCYDFSSGRKKLRQTPRQQIALNDIIFPYIQFENPNFQHVLNYLRAQVLKADKNGSFLDDDNDEPSSIVTKGVFKGLKANVGGVDFVFGTGGIHGSLERKRVISGNGHIIRDIDVASLYPSIAIKNNLAPAHLGEAFTRVYAELPKERKRWQELKGKKCPEANAMKLAANGVYGKSNSKWSPFFDPQFTMTITVNGQLLLCMLAERLIKVPTLQILQINTDGITYWIHEYHEPEAARICQEWQSATLLTLEDVNYKRMWLRDVNSYIAEAADGSLKLKGAYWTPDPENYIKTINESQPPAWHKDLSNQVSIRAAVAYMVHGTDIATFIRGCTNPFDFMCSTKAKGGYTTLWGNEEMFKNTRYYVTTNGKPLTKKMPAAGRLGAYKKASKITDDDYMRVMTEVNWQWDPRVCTKSKTKYDIRESQVVAGYLTHVCNDVKDFHFENINYDWYIREAAALVV